MARPVKSEDTRKENLSGWSMSNGMAREIESFAGAIRLTRSETLEMITGHGLRIFDRKTYLSELRTSLLSQVADIDRELSRLAEYEAQNRLLASAMFRQFYYKHVDRKQKYNHDPVALDDYIKSVVIQRCPGVTYDVAVEIFKATYEDITKERLDKQEAASRATAEKVMGLLKDAKDEGQGKAESPRGDTATET